MDLFRHKTGTITDNIFAASLDELNLNGKNVIVYSRLLSLGRFLSKSAIQRFLEVIQEKVGSNGTLSIPTYTLNSYKEPRVFDFKNSKIMSGVLGEIAAQDNSFQRTIHPVYSNCVYGKHASYLMDQNASTCFGENSFFDLFSKIEDSYVMMIGLNYNGPTLYHYYDQKFNAKGRIVKEFAIKMILEDYHFSMKFNSYVKDYEFYEGKMNCLANFDALAEYFGFTARVNVGDDFIHMISENRFQQLYKIALEIDQNHFLLDKQEMWNEYFMRNNFRICHGQLNQELVTKISKHADFPA